jgi:3,4-dihydroxy 2-butanone 4-phosphate synthase / GTP cyclohydrolase II
MNIEEALKDFADGKFVIITDDESRENEGDLMLLAEKATTESLGFMVRYTSGVICTALTHEIARSLQLPAMVKRNQDQKRTAYTVSVDLIDGNTTGISAQERANTVRRLADSHAKPADFMRPGHVFPLIAHPDLFRARQGHTEAGVAMALLVGARPVAALSEIVNEDGSMARGESLRNFAKAHNIPIFTMQELIDYAEGKLKASQITRPEYSWAKLPRLAAPWEITVHLAAGGAEHAILKLGNPGSRALVRLHSECLTGDAFGSLRCDCGDQLEAAFQKIEAAGSGYIIYLRDHEGRGIGLEEKIAAYALQDKGMDTIDANLALGHEADERDWNDSVEIIQNLELESVTLLTNNPAKSHALRAAGIAVNIEFLQTDVNASNRSYLLTKRNRMSHTLEIK